MVADNILNVRFTCCTDNIKTDPLYQYDYGQQITFSGITLPDTYEVHFAKGESGSATVVIADGDTVDIPDALLTLPGSVHVYIYLHTTDDDGETVYHCIIPVIRRAQPTHEEPTPVQQTEIEQILAQLENYDHAAEEAADEASASATSAANSASSASQSATSAANSASSASQSATSAAQSAASAAQSKEDAETAEENAEHYAEALEQAAANAGYMFFYIDEHGDLIYQRTSNTQVDFYLSDGDLYVKAVN